MPSTSPAGLIYKLIPKIMLEVGAIEKTRRNSTQNYSFRGIDDAYSAFQTILGNNGVFVVPRVMKTTREERQSRSGGGVLIYTILEVSHTFYAEDGIGVEAITIGEAFDSGDKSCNKAMSCAMKYALLEVFCVPTTGDNDTENHSPEPAPRSTTTAPAASTTRPATSTASKPAAAAAPPPVATETRGNQMQAMIMKLGDLASWAPVYFRDFEGGDKKKHCWLGPEEGLDKLSPENIAKYLTHADAYNKAIGSMAARITKENEGK